MAGDEIAATNGRCERTQSALLASRNIEREKRKLEKPSFCIQYIAPKQCLLRAHQYLSYTTWQRGWLMIVVLAIEGGVPKRSLSIHDGGTKSGTSNHHPLAAQWEDSLVRLVCTSSSMKGLLLAPPLVYQ